MENMKEREKERDYMRKRERKGLYEKERKKGTI